MEIKLKNTVNKQVKNNSVVFTMNFYIVKPTADEALSAVAQDIHAIKAELSGMGIDTDRIAVIPIKVAENKEMTEENINGRIQHSYVRNGFYATGGIKVTLPLAWADDTHKFGAVYTLFNGSEAAQSFQYSFICSDKDKYAAELRSELLKEANIQINQILASRKTTEPPVLSQVFYNCDDFSAPDNAPYAAVLTQFNGMPDNEPPMSARLIDLMVTEDTAGTIELSDSITSVWTVNMAD